MPIDPKTAARIAREHGLSLPDARAIAALAESEDDAAEYAELFADGEQADRELKKGEEIARRILGGERL